MNQLVFLYFSSFLVALSGAMMPGPLLTATIGESIKKGAKAGPILMSGHAILELVLVLALMLGLAPLLQQRLFFIIVSFAGAGILLYMAFGMFKDLPTLTVDWSQPKESRGGNMLVSGALLSIANPYWTVWWATIGLSFMIRSQEAGIAGVFAFFLGHQSADFAWYSLVSGAVGKGRKFFNDTVYKTVIAVSALVLCGFAVYFAYSGFQKLA